MSQEDDDSRCSWEGCRNPSIRKKRYCGIHIGRVIAAVRREFQGYQMNLDQPESREPKRGVGDKFFLKGGKLREYRKADR